ncbi:hypothetical protein WMY93_004889 [Mugilogobius chulae]|uniref:Uncharacterized protein n=1 Tax=Mugilogobius chulae TaxID=88201 RepID=A0AAW0PTH2_9GOBI
MSCQAFFTRVIVMASLRYVLYGAGIISFFADGSDMHKPKELKGMWRRRGQIREPCPARAQSAGGNASGKPPYPCSDLEDAPAAARSRHSGQRGARNTNQLPAPGSQKQQQDNNTAAAAPERASTTDSPECHCTKRDM